MKKFDLVVVGGGPGGLMAAKAAAENGLDVALLERKSFIPKITRACSTMVLSLKEYFLGERIRLNTRDKLLTFPVNGFSVRYDGPYKNFYSWQIYAPDGSRIVIGDYEKNKQMGDEGRLSATIDKETLLTQMLEDCEKLHVKIFHKINVVGVKKEKTSVQIIGSNGEIFEGTFVIAADGRNSRIVRALGFNRERVWYGTSSVRGCFLEDVDFPEPESVIKIFIGGNRPIPIGCFFSPRAAGKDREYFAVTSTVNVTADHVEPFEYLLKKSQFSSWFKRVKVGRTLCYAGNMYSPIKKPFRDNVLVIGDAAWSQEADVTGAILSAFRAATAVVVALSDGKISEEGIYPYLEWWKKNYLEPIEHTHLIRNVLLPYVLTQDEMCYYFKQFRKPLPSTLDPYSVPRHIAEATKEFAHIIQKERPEILRKMRIFAETPLDVLLFNHRRYGFPSQNCYNF